MRVFFPDTDNPTSVYVKHSRYQAISNPLGKGKGLMIGRWILRENYVIIAIWLIGFATALPNYLSVTSRSYTSGKETRYTVVENWSESATFYYSIL